MLAAAALADFLLENFQSREVSPIKKITYDVERLRAVFWIPPELTSPNHQWTAEIANDLVESYYAWIAGGRPLILQGCNFTLYEIPERKESDE